MQQESTVYTVGRVLFGCSLAALCLYSSMVQIPKEVCEPVKPIIPEQDITVQPMVEDAEEPRLLVVTRVHMNAASSLPDPNKVLSFIQSCSSYADGIVICLGAHDHNALSGTILKDYMQAIQSLMLENNIENEKVAFVSVIPWGYFTPALNHAIQYAQDNMFNRIAFQSLEVTMAPYDVKRMLKRLQIRNTVVVGAVLEGHEFDAGEEVNGQARKLHSLSGRACPWNTFSIWRVRELGFIGFPLIGDGTGFQRRNGGVEEVTAITLMQRINPNYIAVLLKIVAPEGISAGSTHAKWDTNFQDPRRKQYHERKMESKVRRPVAQLEEMGIAPGVVLHEIDTGK